MDEICEVLVYRRGVAEPLRLLAEPDEGTAIQRALSIGKDNICSTVSFIFLDDELKERSKDWLVADIYGGEWFIDRRDVVAVTVAVRR
jgi:hypothetical protein